jgi:hypothetical protein
MCIDSSQLPASASNEDAKAGAVFHRTRDDVKDERRMAFEISLPTPD